MTIPAQSSTLDVRVYYEDTDFSGRVYHASYLRFMERGRTEWLRLRGFEHRALSTESGLVFAVRGVHIEYLAPAVIDDLLRVETRLAGAKGAVIAFDELNLKDWRGESIAVLESLKLRDYRIERCWFGSVMSFAQIE